MSDRGQIEFLDINAVCADLRQKYSDLTVDERAEKVLKELSGGVTYKGKLLKVVNRTFFNPLANKENRWFYFVCPQCSRNVRRVYLFKDDFLKCRTCIGLKDKREVRVRTPIDKMFRIQDYLGFLLDPTLNLSTKKKNQYLKLIEKHYTELNDAYKTAYNGFLIRGLLSWCNKMINSEEKSVDYKEAMSDVIRNLKMMKLVLTQKKMKKEKALK